MKICKRLLSILLCILLIGSAAATGVSAMAAPKEHTSGEWTYEEVESGYVILTHCSKTSVTGKIEIPSEIDGNVVAGWEKEAFRGLSGYTFVIPATWPECLAEAPRSVLLYLNCLEGLHDLLKYSFEQVAASAFVVDAGNKYLTSVDDVLYTKDDMQLVKYPVCKSATFFEMPDSVTGFFSNAFIATVAQNNGIVRKAADSDHELTVHLPASYIQKAYDMSYNTYLPFSSENERQSYALHETAWFQVFAMLGTTVICTDWNSPTCQNAAGETIDLFDVYEKILSDELSDWDFTPYVDHLPLLRHCNHPRTSFFDRLIRILKVIFFPITWLVNIVKWFFNLF